MLFKTAKLPYILILLVLSGTILFAASSQAELADGGMSELILSSFAAGILLTFTPCVLPMVPILSSIIAGQGERISRAKALWLSFSYVLGTAATYAIMGALAGATGEQLQSYFQNVWAIGLITLIFVLMALSMFGLYTIQLPSFIQSRLNASSQEIKGGSAPMVFLLGMISALIIGACVSPVLIAFLGVAMSKADALLGAMTMFFMALGMGVPLMLVGLGMGALLPKAGAWMDKIKYVFGVLLLATAIYLFNTLELLPPLLLWGIFLMIVSIYLGAAEPLDKEAGGWMKLAKGAGIVLLVWGIFMLIGSMYGQKDPLKPLPPFPSAVPNTTTVVPEHKMPFETVRSMEAFEAKREEAKEKHKLLIAFFSHDLCGSCKKYKATTFKDPAVLQTLQKEYVAVQVNMTDKSDTKVQAIKKHFRVFGPPTFIFFDREGDEVEGNRIYGYQSPDEFLDMLEMMAE